MRPMRGGVSFAGVLGAGVPGAYFGAVAAGLLAVVTGQVRDPAAMAGLAVLGAAGGWLVAILTRWAPAVHRRVAVFTGGGLVSFPLAVSIGQLQHQWAEVGIGSWPLGGWSGPGAMCPQPARPGAEARGRAGCARSVIDGRSVHHRAADC
jgi:hypothetical protein